MKKLHIFIFAICLFSTHSLLSQNTIKVYPFNYDYGTGYLSLIDKESGVALQQNPNFFMFDLSPVPKHATITNIDLSYFVYYASVSNRNIFSDIYIIDINTYWASYNDLWDSVTNASTKVWRGEAYSGQNYGNTWNTATLDTIAEIYANNVLYNQGWMSTTIKFDSHNWTIHGYLNGTTRPYLDVTYTDGIPVTDIEITTVTGSNKIDSYKGSLQLLASVSPDTCAYDSVLWTTDDYGDYYANISPDGVVTAKGIGNGTATITITATAYDGSGVTKDFDVAISNQKAVLVEENSVDYQVFPNPATDVLNIHLASDKIHTIDILNSVGVKVYSESNCSGKLILDVSSLAKGVYFVSIDGEIKNSLSFIKD